MIFHFIMDLGLVLFAHGDGCLQPCGQTSFFQREMVMLPESLDKTPLHEGLSNRDERDEGKEEGKRRGAAIDCQGGAVEFMFLSRPLPLRRAASPTFLTLSHELGSPLLGSGKWPPRSVGPNEKELQPRMRSWQHQPGTSRVGLNFAGGLSKAKHQAPSAKYQAPSSWACRAAYTAIVPFLAAHTTAVRRGYWTAASSRGVDIRPSQRCGERLQA